MEGTAWPPPEYLIQRGPEFRTDLAEILACR